MFLKNRNISSKIKMSKVTDYAALSWQSVTFGKINCTENITFDIKAYIGKIVENEVTNQNLDPIG